jgi:hypothetical protein
MLLIAAFVALTWPWLVAGTVTVPYDAKSQFFPQQIFLARALAEGQSPFWTPNVFAGWPQIADPQSLIFSPLHFLLALVDRAPSFRTVDAVSYAMLFLGALGITLYFRDRGWHVAGALVAALAFAFGGSCASRIQHTGQIISLAWLPLALWLTARALDRGSWRAGLGAGMFGGLIAIGRDQVAMLSLYLLAAFVVAHWAADRRPLARIGASIKPLVAAAIAGTLIAVVPILLTLLLAADSNRPEIVFSEAGRGSLHPGDLFMLAFENLFGSSDWQRDHWGPGSYEWHQVFGQTGLFNAQNVGQIYAGALPLVAVLGIGLIRGAAWSREATFFLIAAIVVLLYALGWYTPAFRVIYEIFPGVQLFRRPADATFVFGFLYAVLAGYCVHRWIEGTVPRSTWLHRALDIAVVVAIVGGAIGLAAAAGFFVASAVSIVAGMLWAAGAIVLLIIVRRGGRTQPLAAACLVAAFLTADLAFNNAPNESTGLPPAFYDALRLDTEDETVAILKLKLAETTAADRRDRVELIGVAYHWPNIALIHDFDHLFGHNPLRLRDFARATGVGDTVAGPDQRTFSPLFPSYRSLMADLFGVRFIAFGVPVEQFDSALKPGDLNFIARTKDAYIYENPRALPRAMLVAGWQAADFGAMLRDGGWPAFDPRRTVLLERAPASIASLPDASGGTVRIAHYEQAEIAVEVDAPSGGFLLLNDVWHPWWRASVDGRPAEILKANVLFRAVHVEPGRHVVRFVFHPIAGAFAQVVERLRPHAQRACSLVGWSCWRE